MKILHFTDAFATGVLSVLEGSVKGILRSSNHVSVTIVYCRRPESPQDFTNTFDPNVNLIELKADLSHPTGFVEAITEFRKLLNDLCPDVVHFHSSRAGIVGRTAMLFNQKNPATKSFYSPHGFAFMRKDVGLVLRLLFYVIEGVFSLHRTTIVAVGEDEAKAARALSSRVVTVANFVDEGLITSFISGEGNKNGKVIVTSGRICEQKNPRLFNEVASSLPDLQFIWVGDGPLRDCLQAPNITVTGMVPRSSVYSYLSSAEVYIQCSRWEGLPMSVLEAMSLGVPVILSDIRGHQEIGNRIDVEGIIASSLDDFRVRICRLLDNPDLRNSMSRACKAVIASNYSFEKAIKQYVDLYGIPVVL